MLDTNHEIDKLYRYTAMGPNLISKEELLNDTNLFNSYGLSLRNNIKVYSAHGLIVDNKDTFPIVDYWQKEKLLFVDNVKFLRAGRTLIYGHD